MLNEAPNSNNIMRIEGIMLNKVPVEKVCTRILQFVPMAQAPLYFTYTVLRYCMTKLQLHIRETNWIILTSMEIYVVCKAMLENR